MKLYETSFEGPFAYYGGASELEVPADGWIPLWVQGTRPGVNHRPEYKPESDRVRTGRRAAKLFTTHASHDAVLARVIALGGQQGEVKVRAYGATFGLKAGQALRVGIDPTGQTQFPSDAIQWGEWWGQYSPDWAAEAYHEFALGAMPGSNQVTVFLHSRSDYAASTVAAYWDDVTVEQAGDGGGGEPGEGVDYALIRQIIETALAEREPARWPR